VRFYHAPYVGSPKTSHLFTPIGLVLFWVPLAVWCVRAAGRRDGGSDGGNRALFLLLPYITLPAIGTYLLSGVANTHLFVDYPFIFAVAPSCLLTAAAAARLHTRPLRIAVLSALGVWSVCASYRAEALLTNAEPRWESLASCAMDERGPPAPAESWNDTVPYAAYLELSGRRAGHVPLFERLSPTMPDRFWLTYRILRDSPAEAEQRAAEVRSAGFETIRKCGQYEIDARPFHVVFELESRVKPTPGPPPR
jgi:hypothetical protein